MTPGAKTLADIPVHQHTAVELGDLGVEQHLGPLRNDPSGCAELLGDVRAEKVAEPQRAGEYHRCQHLGATVAAEVTQHRQPGVCTVACGAAQGFLHRLRPRRRRARTGQIDVEQQRGGEVTDQQVDVWMQGLATEQRQVQQEPRRR